MTLEEDLFLPSSSSLHTLIFGKSGSGKTYGIRALVMKALPNKKFGKNHRFIIIDPKVQAGDYDELTDPITDDNIETIAESLNENRLTLVWPSYEFGGQLIDQIIELLFAIADSFPDFSATLILDESGEYITHNSMPNSIGKLAVQGRAKKLKGVFLNQRPILNRKLDSQVQSIVLFDMVTIDMDNLSKRWGINWDIIQGKIMKEQHSFYHKNFMSNKSDFYHAISMD